MAIATDYSKVTQFIKKHIHSVWQLELILILRACAQPLTADAIGQRLYMEPEVLKNVLDALVRQGVLKAEDLKPKTYVYSPTTEDLSEAVEQTAKAYAERRMSVIDLIFASPFQADGDGTKNQ